MLGVLEPLLERMVFEDVPSNLAAIKLRVETIQVGRGHCSMYCQHILWSACCGFLGLVCMVWDVRVSPAHCLARMLHASNLSLAP